MLSVAADLVLAAIEVLVATGLGLKALRLLGIKQVLLAEGYRYVALNLSGYRFVTGPESLYPVTAEDRALVTEMYTKWSAVADIGDVYQVYALDSEMPHD